MLIWQPRFDLGHCSFSVLGSWEKGSIGSCFLVVFFFSSDLIFVNVLFPKNFPIHSV